MRLLLVVLAVSMPLLQSCTSSKTSLILISEQDIYYNDRGDICLTPYYFNEILQAKIEREP